MLALTDRLGDMPYFRAEKNQLIVDLVKITLARTKRRAPKTRTRSMTLKIQNERNPKRTRGEGMLRKGSYVVRETNPRKTFYRSTCLFVNIDMLLSILFLKLLRP